MFVITNMHQRRLSVALVVISAAIGCGSTDHVIGSLLGARAGAGAPTNSGGAPLSEFAGAGGEGGNGGTSGEATSLLAACGDGVESETESCDDGNRLDGDGCSSECTWEPPRGKPQAPPYGSAVAVSGDTLVTGPFVFRLQGLLWSLEAKLAPSASGGGPDPNDDPSSSTFANAVAISGDTIAVGAQNDSEAAPNAGAVHIFQRTGSTWVWQEKLMPVLSDGTPDGVDSAHFGWQLAFSADTLVVGAQGDDDQGTSSGSVYVFRRSTARFVPEAKLVATLPGGTPDGGPFFHFGTSVSLSGDTLVAGSTGTIRGSVTNAAAYVFTRRGSTWTPRAKLLPTLPDGTADVTEGSLFGASVAIAGDTLVVGDPGSSVSTGCAYVFARGAAGWSAEAKLHVPPTPLVEGDVAEFGRAAAISSAGDLILIGSPSDTHAAGYATGSGHVFERDGASWVYSGELLGAALPESVNPFNGSVGSYVAVSGSELLVGSESASYLFRPKNGTWDTRLAIQIFGP